MKKNILVLFGGCSPEYPISLKSAYAVLTHINADKYNVLAMGITKDGQWLRYNGDYENILADTWHQDRRQCTPAFLSPDRSVHGIGELTEKGLSFTYVDAVFPVLHGKNGEDGSVQGLAEIAGVPIIGCGALSSALCMDKYRAHQIVSLAGVQVPKAVFFDRKPAAETLYEETKSLSYPLFVKPLRAGSSFGISKITEKAQLADAVDLAFRYDSEIIVEENIEGFEVGCAVLGNDELILGRVDEIELSHGFFDYKEKYTQRTAKIHMPARIDADTEERVREAAAKIYRALACSGFARVDMFLTPSGEIVFNEVNTIPGCTDCSRYPSMLQGVGLDYAAIVEKLISLEI